MVLAIILAAGLIVATGVFMVLSRQTVNSNPYHLPVNPRHAGVSSPIQFGPNNVNPNSLQNLLKTSPIPGSQPHPYKAPSHPYVPPANSGGGGGYGGISQYGGIVQISYSPPPYNPPANNTKVYESNMPGYVITAQGIQPAPLAYVNVTPQVNYIPPPVYVTPPAYIPPYHPPTRYVPPPVYVTPPAYIPPYHPPAPAPYQPPAPAPYSPPVPYIPPVPYMQPPSSYNSGLYAGQNYSGGGNYDGGGNLWAGIIERTMK